MKRFLAIAFTVSLGMLATNAFAITVSDYAPGDAAGGIGGSRHNLGTTGRYIMTPDSGTTNICIFCHAPHGGPDVAPVWNRSTTNAASYSAYGTTIAGTTIADSDLGSTTLACLSCHDGVTTFDTLVSRPGKDGDFGEDQGWTFFEDGTIVSDFITSGRLIIGLALSDDHPVSVPYTPGYASLRATDTNIASIDLAFGLGSTNTNITQNLWAVEGYFSTDTTINDLLRDNTNAGAMTVECSSCHDPHFSNKSYDEVEWTWDGTAPYDGAGGELYADGFFLRRVGGNGGSGVCRTCHNK